MMRTFTAVLLAVALFAMLEPGLLKSGFAECQGAFTYLVEVDNGGYYALVGLPTELRAQYENHTTRIVVNGTYFPSNPNQYLHPDRNFRGLIYVTQYVISGVTFSNARTLLTVSGTVTITSTQTNQIIPTTITAATGTATLSPISVSGLLDYSSQYCVTPVITGNSSVGGSSGQSITGFTSFSIILGLIAGITFLVISRRRREIRSLTPSV